MPKRLGSAQYETFTVSNIGDLARVCREIGEGMTRETPDEEACVFKFNNVHFDYYMADGILEIKIFDIPVWIRIPGVVRFTIYNYVEAVVWFNATNGKPNILVKSPMEYGELSIIYLPHGKEVVVDCTAFRDSGYWIYG